MFSSRLNWGASENPLAKLLQQKRAIGEPILDLTESNPTAAGFAYREELLLPALADARALRYEPHPAGLASARAAVANYYGNVSADRIFLTASTSEGYEFLFKLLADPGDEILVPRPSYPLFEFLAALESARPVQYPLTYEGRWWIDFEALGRCITPRSRAIVLVNPNNPTGSFLKEQELSRLIALCREHQLAIISDEVFCDYVLNGDGIVKSLADVGDVLSFVLSGFSKVLGLPQMKLSWIVCGGPELIRAQAMERLELIADTYLSVGTPIQWAAERLLSWRSDIQGQILKRVWDNRRLLSGRIGPTSPWRVLESEGGWYTVLEAPKIHSEEEWVLSLLRDDGVLVQPGYFFDFEKEAYLIVSLLTHPEVFRVGVDKILTRAR